MSISVPHPAHDTGRSWTTSSARPLDALLTELAEQLPPAQIAFFFDVDGTLIDIAPHPDAVEVPAGLISDLKALSTAAGGALALVSGREAAVLDALFHPLELAISGVHGAQVRHVPGGEIVEMGEWLDPGLRAELAALTSKFDGVLVEDKGQSVALHYRNRPAIAPELEAEIARIIAADARTLTVLPGRMVFEIKRRSHDKGAAVRAFMAEPPFAGRVPVFLGDDVTDEAGFAAVREMDGIAISVGRRLPGADITLPEAQDVRTLVKRLAQTAERRD